MNLFSLANLKKRLLILLYSFTDPAVTVIPARIDNLG